MSCTQKIIYQFLFSNSRTNFKADSDAWHAYNYLQKL